MTIAYDAIEHYVFNNSPRKIREYIDVKGKDYNYTLVHTKIHSDLSEVEVEGKFKYFDKEVKSIIIIKNFMSFLTHGLVLINSKEVNDVYQLDKELWTPMITDELIKSKWKSIVSLRFLYLLHVAIKDSYYVIQKVATDDEVDRLFDLYSTRDEPIDRLEADVNYYSPIKKETTTNQLIDKHIYYEYYKAI